MDTNSTLELAREAISHNNLQLAQKILRRLIQQDPKNPAAWLLLAEVVENPEHARQCLERVIKLQPDNKDAKGKLAKLEDPFAELAAFAEPGETLPAGADSRQEFTPIIYGEPDEATASVEEHPLIQPTGAPPGEQKSETQSTAKRTTKAKGKPPKPQKKSSRWLEISLGVLAVMCLCVVALIVIGQNPSLLQTGPEPTPENPLDAIIKNRDTANAEDLDGYMDTIHPKAAGRFFTRTAMRDLFDKYDLRYDVYNLQIVEQTEDEIRVAFTLITRKIRGPAFNNNRVDGIMILRQDDGQWKIYDQEVTEVTYIE